MAVKNENKRWRRRRESETREKTRGREKGKVIKVRGEGERLETPLNKSELPSYLSVSRLFLLVTEDQVVLVTEVLLCVIGWMSGQCVCVCVCVCVWKDSINNAWIGATGRDKESCWSW